MGETIVKCPNCRGELIADSSQLYDGVNIECLNCGHKFTYTTRKASLMLGVRDFDMSRTRIGDSSSVNDYKAIGNGRSFTTNGIDFAPGEHKGETFNDFCKRNVEFYNFYDKNKTFFMSQETLDEAWDRMCEAQDEYVEYSLAMFAEYAFAATDRRRLAKVFTDLLTSIRGNMRNEFSAILDELKMTGFEREKVIPLRDELEEFASAISLRQSAFNEDYFRKVRPKPERIAIKSDFQDAKLASAFMVMFDAILCDAYSHGKLIMFFMMLNDYILTQDEGTILGEYGLKQRISKSHDDADGVYYPPMLVGISFKSVDNPFKR